MAIKRFLVFLIIFTLIITVNYLPVSAEVIPLKELEQAEMVLYGEIQEPSIIGKIEKLEYTLFGKKGEGSLKERGDRIVDIVFFTSEKQTSLVLYVNVLEWTLKNRIERGNILGRLEQLEQIVYGNYQEGPLLNRLGNLVKLSLVEGELPARHVILPADTMINIRLLNEINTAEVTIGQLIDYEITKDVKVDGYLVIPAGTRGQIEIDTISSASHFGKDAEIDFTLPELYTIDGSKVPVNFSINEEKTYSRETAVGLSLLGLIITSHPIGLAVSYFYKGRDVVIPEGTKITIETRAEIPTYGLKF